MDSCYTKGSDKSDTLIDAAPNHTLNVLKPGHPYDSIMKELNIIIPHERLSDVNRILYKHKAGGMYFYEITGRGRAERPERETTTIEGYRTGKRYIPEFGSRTMVVVIIPDSMEKPLVDEIISTTSTGSAADGKIFVKEIANGYDIGTKHTGEIAATE